MKPALLFLCFWISMFGLEAQDLKVVASAGQSYSTVDLQLDWTLGEPVILTYDNGTIILTQGFHQPDYHLISSTYTPTFNGQLDLTPNPVADVMTIHLSMPVADHGMFILYDPSGKPMLEKAFSGENIKEEMNLTSFPAGTYFLYVVIPEQQSYQAKPLIKL